MERKEKIFIILIVLIFLNLLFLDYKLLCDFPAEDGVNRSAARQPAGELESANRFAICGFKIFLGKKESEEVEKPVEKQEIKEKTATPGSGLNFCPEACVTKINEATESLKLTPAEKVVEKVAEKQTTQTEESGLKEFFIPLGGSGSTTEGGWKDIAGMEVYVDRGKYPNKISVFWEASLKVKDGNGEAHARLFNVNKNGAVDYSEITSIGPDYKRVTSNKINLASGNNLYKVQMFSTTQYEVFIQGARVKITVE